MGRGKTRYNKETERARQLNERQKKKHTGQIQNRLCEKIYGKEEVNSELSKDFIHSYESKNKNSVIMGHKNKHLDKFRDYYFKKADEKEQIKIEEEIFKNLDKFKCFKFKSEEDALKFKENFEDIHKNLIPYYGRPFPGYHILKSNYTGEVVGFFSKEYFPEEQIIKLRWSGDDFIEVKEDD